MWQPDLLLLSPTYHQLQQRHWCHLHRQLHGRLLYVFVLLISMLLNRAHVYTPSLAHWQVFAPAPPSLQQQASLLSPRPSVASQTIRRWLEAMMELPPEIQLLQRDSNPDSFSALPTCQENTGAMLLCIPASNASLSRYRSKSSFLSCPSYSSPSRCLCLGPGARQRARGRLEGASCTCLNHQITDGNTTTRLVCCSQQNNEGKVILIQ